MTLKPPALWAAGLLALLLVAGAGYFSMRTSNRQAAAPLHSLRPDDPQVLRVGARIYAQQCAACHGAQLTGTTPATPGLLGLPRDYINAQMGAWRTGARRGAQPDCMADIARRMKPEDIASVSTWLSSQPWPANTRTPTQSATTPPLKCGSHAQAQERP